MKAMILAAGTGTRLRPLTYTTPKPLTRLVSTPVMETQIRHLAAAGVTEIVINTSYLSQLIESHFGNGNAWGVDIAYSFEGSVVNGTFKGNAIGSAGGIRKIHDHSQFFNEPFLVLCGDAFVNFDIDEFSRAHSRSAAIGSILTQNVSESVVEKYGVVVTDDSDRVTSFQEKPAKHEAKSLEANTGIYLFDPGILNHIPDGQVFDIGSQLFPELVAKGVPLFAHNQRFDWLDIGSIGDLFAANSHLLSVPTKGFSLPGREVRKGLWVGPNCRLNPDTLEVRGNVVIEGSCRIDPGVSLIGPSVIGRGCVVETGATVRESYLGPYMKVKANGCLDSKVVQGEYAASPDGSYHFWRTSQPDLGYAQSTQGSGLLDSAPVHAFEVVSRSA